MNKTTLGFLMVLAIPALACSGADRKKDHVLTSSPVKSSMTSEGLVADTADLDNDGDADVWMWYKPVGKGASASKVLVRKATDINGDGRVDVTEYYGADGKPEREEIDLDYDGTPDKVRLYDKGALVREEIATMFDGRVDVKRYYENGALVLKLVDSNRDAVFEEFHYFEGANLARIGWDRDGDGKPEIFEENPAFASQD